MLRTIARYTFASSAVLFAIACSSSSSGTGGQDSGPTPEDTGAPHDSGTKHHDSGTPDAGVHETGTHDTGAHDSGIDSGVDATGSCTDGVKNGSETAVDCGGSCPPCATGKACAVPADCASGDCAADVCTCNAAAGCVACTTVADCPVDSNFCTIAACTGLVCGTVPVKSGTVLPDDEQTPGDCATAVCDGMGGMTTQPDATDVPPSSGTVCATMPTCSGTPLAPSYTFAASGASCLSDMTMDANVCGTNPGPKAGKCVECNTSEDCALLTDGAVPDCVDNVCAGV